MFDALGDKVFHVGERPGQGAMVKTVNQLLCGVHIAVVAEAFSQRRKTLRNALASIVDADALVRASIDPGARGETLSVADFVRLANLDAAGAAHDLPDEGHAEPHKRPDA